LKDWNKTKDETDNGFVLFNVVIQGMEYPYIWLIPEIKTHNPKTITDKHNVEMTIRVNCFLINRKYNETLIPIAAAPSHTISCTNSLLEPMKPRTLVKNIKNQTICKMNANLIENLDESSI
jgi:hypothetical protein